MWHELTLITAMIQKAYDTLVTTTPFVYRGYWEVLCSGAPCPARVFRRCSRSELDELAVQLDERTQLSSARNGSTTRGLTNAPRPMKKCKAWWEEWRLRQHEVVHNWSGGKILHGFNFWGTNLNYLLLKSEKQQPNGDQMTGQEGEKPFLGGFWDATKTSQKIFWWPFYISWPDWICVLGIHKSILPYRTCTFQVQRMSFFL